jgi:hypothetical protein
MRLSAIGFPLLLSSSFAALGACATYEDDLMRGQTAFEQSEHERALAIFRALEQDTERLSVVGRAHYAYLRGMTDYRIGYKSEARHWLAIATALGQKTPGSLPPEWEKRMTESLEELNEEVFAGGVAALSNTAPTKGKTADGDEPDAASEPSVTPAPAQGAP